MTEDAAVGGEVDCAMMDDQASQRPEYVRVRELLPLLLRVTAVLVQEGDQWGVVGREYYQAAQGPTKAKAILAFETALAASILLHVHPEVAKCLACPDDVWAELIAREGAEICTFGFHQYNGEAQDVRVTTG